jgi:hypothetical protein
MDAKNQLTTVAPGCLRVVVAFEPMTNRLRLMIPRWIRGEKTFGPRLLLDLFSTKLVLLKLDLNLTLSLII